MLTFVIQPFVSQFFFLVPPPPDPPPLPMNDEYMFLFSSLA